MYKPFPYTLLNISNYDIFIARNLYIALPFLQTAKWSTSKDNPL